MGPVAGRASKGQPDRKIQRTFDRRTNDYARMQTSTGNYKNNPGGYHRPGSMQKGRCR